MGRDNLVLVINKGGNQSGKEQQQAYRDMTKEVRKLRDDILGTKDRVDISLNEYKKLIHDRDLLQDRCLDYEKVLMSLGINPEMCNHIKSHTIIVMTNRSDIDFKRRVRIQFELEDDAPDWPKDNPYI